MGSTHIEMLARLKKVSHSVMYFWHKTLDILAFIADENQNKTAR
jgi:hypothetical protein